MFTHTTTSLTVRVSDSAGDVEALLLRPDDANWLLVFAHGAGAGMHHPFMEHLAGQLAGCSVATLRYHFPYMQHRRKRPDPPAVLTATVRAAVAAASETAPGLPLLAGGKSLGGRMTSLTVADERSAPGPGIASVRGLVFFGFPLHPAGRPGTQRAEHLARVRIPMLFVQGTRDALADLALLRPLCDTLVPLSTLHVVEGGDHSFHMLKRFGKTDADVVAELARTAASWAETLG
ncbi:MAG TPA: alpha/beta family hydrolase [Nitrospira sp.]|nr:alpha/beta family hydrolase [Nitrospira sp.]